jgi:hypothetical protein
MEGAGDYDPELAAEAVEATGTHDHASMMAALNLKPYEKPTHGGIPNYPTAAAPTGQPQETLPLPGREDEAIIVGGGSQPRWGESGYTGKKPKVKEEAKKAPEEVVLQKADEPSLNVP